jgi:hypothetical protein
MAVLSLFVSMTAVRAYVGAQSMSSSAAERIGMIDQGVTKVKLDVIH